VKRNLKAAIFLGLAAFSPAWGQVASHAPTASVGPAVPVSSGLLQPVGKPLLRVNGAVLTDVDLANEVVAMFPFARQHNGGVPKSMEPEMRQGAVQMMVFEELIYQDAKKRQMTVSPERIAAAELQFRKQFSSPAEFQQFLQLQFHGNRKLLDQKIARSLLIEKYLKLEVMNQAVVTPTEVKAYFDKHPEKFRVQESFAFQSISFLPPQNSNAAQLAEARKRAQDALRQAKATKSYEEFGLLAEKISEDDFRVMMGDHKTAESSKLPPVVSAALAGLKPGQISDVVEIGNSVFTILRLNQHIPGGQQKFEAVKVSLQQQLQKEKADQLRSALAAKLSKNATIEKL